MHLIICQCNWFFKILASYIFVHFYRWWMLLAVKRTQLSEMVLLRRTCLTHFQFVTLFTLIFDTEIYICNQTSAKLARKSNIFQCFINLQRFLCKVNMYTAQGVHILWRKWRQKVWPESLNRLRVIQNLNWPWFWKWVTLIIFKGCTNSNENG